MSDLANSCEYLTFEKLCSAVSESEKAKARRQVRCQNDEKTTCCYLCLTIQGCTIKCKFLGNTENDISPIESEKTEPENAFDKAKEPKAYQKENAPTVCCSSCNVGMAQTRTKFSINGWEGKDPKLGGDGSGKLELQAIVYVCPQCGKVEFRADKN